MTSTKQKTQVQQKLLEDLLAQEDRQATLTPVMEEQEGTKEMEYSNKETGEGEPSEDSEEQAFATSTKSTGNLLFDELSNIDFANTPAENQSATYENNDLLGLFSHEGSEQPKPNPRTPMPTIGSPTGAIDAPCIGWGPAPVLSQMDLAPLMNAVNSISIAHQIGTPSQYNPFNSSNMAAASVSSNPFAPAVPSHPNPFHASQVPAPTNSTNSNNPFMFEPPPDKLSAPLRPTPPPRSNLEKVENLTHKPSELFSELLDLQQLHVHPQPEAEKQTKLNWKSTSSSSSQITLNELAAHTSLS